MLNQSQRQLISNNYSTLVNKANTAARKYHLDVSDVTSWAHELVCNLLIRHPHLNQTNIINWMSTEIMGRVSEWNIRCTNPRFYEVPPAVDDTDDYSSTGCATYNLNQDNILDAIRVFKKVAEVSPNDAPYLNLIFNEYNPAEISRELKVSKVAVGKHCRRVKKLIQQLSEDLQNV